MPKSPSVDIDLPAFHADPYPTLARLRREAPIAFVPQLGSTLLTRLDDIVIWEKRTDVFSSHQPQGLMNRVMGQNMMRKDGQEHLAERKVFLKAVSPQAVKQVWTQCFRMHAHRILDDIAPLGTSPRRVAQEVTIGDATLEPESRAFLMFGSANRDDAHFEAADAFRPTRNTSKAIAFGAGPHFCAGTWATRDMVANVALPLAFERLPGLAIDPRETIEIAGWAFRGLRNLPVTWTR